MKVKDYKCPRCDSDDFLIIRSNEYIDHVGLFCSKCGKHLRWLNKEEKGDKDISENIIDMDGKIQVVLDIPEKKYRQMLDVVYQIAKIKNTEIKTPKEMVEAVVTTYYWRNLIYKARKRMKENV